MVKNIESRLDRLKRAIPGPGVGIMHQTETGWTVYRGALQRDFHSAVSYTHLTLPTT